MARATLQLERDVLGHELGLDLGRFDLDDGLEQLALGFEMLVEDRLGDADGFGQRARRGSAEAALGEQTDGGLHDRGAPFFGCHSLQIRPPGRAGQKTRLVISKR